MSVYNKKNPMIFLNSSKRPIRLFKADNSIVEHLFLDLSFGKRGEKMISLTDSIL